MRSVFFGTPDFAAIVLREFLASGIPPTALVTNPDRPQGRKKTITPPPAKKFIQDNSPETLILQPEKLSEIRDRLLQLEADVFIVAAYAKIIPRSILDIPRKGVVGVHPSLLPRLRGASPIQSAILSGEKETGVSLYLMDADMDHGPVFLEEKLEDYSPDADTSATLLPRLAELGGKMLAQNMPAIIDGTLRPVEQDHASATFTKKFSTEDAFIPYADIEAAQNGDTGMAAKMDRKIRAFYPEPVAWTMKQNKRMRILDSGLRDGRLVLKKIQMEGKLPQDLPF